MTVRHLRIAEKWRLYENVDDVDFVKKLNHPDLFGSAPVEIDDVLSG